jgi:hypothetical protein
LVKCPERGEVIKHCRSVSVVALHCQDDIRASSLQKNILHCNIAFTPKVC